MKNTAVTTTKRTERGASKLAIGLVSLGSGLALLMTPLGASGQAKSIADLASSQITIVQTATDPAPNVDCVPAALAIINGTVTPQPFGNSSIFRVSIHSTAPLCEPLQAKAVVYSMPGGLAQPWPQTLKEVKTFSISVAGDTVITFAKGCDPVQFDVIAGDAPQVINTGFDAGLLFPGNLETAFQDPGKSGEQCVDNSSTSAPTTTAPVTTTTAVVLSSTTIKTGTTTTTVKPAVLSATTTPSSTAAAGLAATGTTSRPFALIGGGLVLIGLASVLASRRRLA
ncbi:MAG: hypothetical protein U0Q22_18640 [Acidimicrobiales bacterium]